jgi:hypothetical protein
MIKDFSSGWLGSGISAYQIRGLAWLAAGAEFQHPEAERCKRKAIKQAAKSLGEVFGIGVSSNSLLWRGKGFFKKAGIPARVLYNTSRLF